MGLGELAEKFNNSRIKQLAERFFGSYVFPYVTAALTVLCSALGLEPLIIWFICLCGAAVIFCRKDVSPVITLLIFLNVFVSMQHSPDKRGIEWCDPTYMTSVPFLVQASIAVAIFVIPVLYRLVDGVVKRRFKPTPMFMGLCVFCTALVMNGLFAENYYYMNIIYGLGLAAILLVMFVFISGNVQPDETTYKRIAVTFTALCAALALQLLVAYITLDVVQGGQIDRGSIKFGWGTYNQFGVLITMCLPAWFYLAIKCRHGWAFLFGALFNLAVVVLSMSRQAIMASVFIIIAGLVWYFIATDKKKRIIGGAVAGAVLLITLIFIIVKQKELGVLFSDLGASFITGSGRTNIWKDGIKKFMDYPLFGNGFYDITAKEWLTPGYCGEGSGFTQAIPFMCHNTFVQLLFSCGLIGFGAYILHRVQTVISLFRNPDGGRILIVLTLCGLLATSLLDNHIFYPLPLFVYAMLLAVFTVSEKKQDKEERSAPHCASGCGSSDG